LNAVAADPGYKLGNLRLDVEQRALIGPRGELILMPQLFRLAERLMRRPGMVVPFSDVVGVLYPDADVEPDNAEVVMRIRIQQMRAALLLLAEGAREGNVRVRTERGIGYALEVWRV
jgi:two-component system OmpR family response regulator